MGNGFGFVSQQLSGLSLQIRGTIKISSNKPLVKRPHPKDSGPL